MKKFIAIITVLAFSAAAHGQLVGSFPAEGGAISVEAVGGDIVAAGLDFTSASGGLIPAPGTDASPFTFFLANTPNQVTYGNLGSSVTFASGSTTALSVGATAGTADIVAAWGDGANPVAFEVSAAGGEEPAPVSADLSGLTAIFAPGDAIWGGQVADGAFNIGSDSGGDANRWPGGENPTFAIDGAGQKYLNFGKTNTGFVVTPAASSVVQGLTFTAANDAVPRDPASYEIWGTNASLDAGEGFFDLADFTAISTGALALPDSRNGGGDTALDPANQFSVAFENAASYDTYAIIFPTVKDEGAANSMQIADVQAFGSVAGPVVPEPASATLLALAGVFGLTLRRRRR